MGAEGSGALAGGMLSLPLGPLSSMMLPGAWKMYCEVHENMGPLEQARWHAQSAPEHKAGAVKYFLRVFIIHESSSPVKVFLETPLGSTNRERKKETFCMHLHLWPVCPIYLNIYTELSLDDSLAQWSSILCLQL